MSESESFFQDEIIKCVQCNGLRNLINIPYTVCALEIDDETVSARMGDGKFEEQELQDGVTRSGM